MDEKKYFNDLQLLYENDNGEFFNGSLSVISKENLKNYILNLTPTQKSKFFLSFIKKSFLNTSFLDNGATLNDISALISWLEYNYF